MERRGTRRWIGAALVLGLLGASPASAQFRWPWEKPEKDEKKEKVEPAETPTSTRTRTQPQIPPRTDAQFSGEDEDREMLPRLAAYYREQLDLSDRALASSRNAEVKDLAERLNGDAERALGVINERARELNLALAPHVRAGLADKLRQAGGRRGLGTRPGDDRNEKWNAQEDIAFLDEVMANVAEVRADFASYKEQEREDEFRKDLARLFDDELVPLHDDAKALHDRIRNESR